MTVRMIGRSAAAIVFALGAGAIASPAQAADLCNNGNIDGTLNNPARDFTPCSFASEAHITSIMTYHWNSGRGAPGGTVRLRNSQSGQEYGPFPVATTPGQGGVPNAYWTAHVDITVPAGDYQVIDSDVASWSWNPASQGNGIVTVSGEFTDDEDDNDDGDHGDDGDTGDGGHGSHGGHGGQGGGDDSDDDRGA